MTRQRLQEFALLGGSMFAGSTDDALRSFWLDWLVMCAAVLRDMDSYQRRKMHYRRDKHERKHLPWMCEGCAVTSDDRMLPRGWGFSGRTKFPTLSRTNRGTWCNSCIVNGLVAV